MNWIYGLAGFIAVFLLIYLLYTLLNAEEVE